MSGHNTGAVLTGRVTTRGSSNSDQRGSSLTRRRRREWLVKTYRSDRDVIVVRYVSAPHREDLSRPEIWILKDQSDFGFASTLSELEEDDAFEVVAGRTSTCRCYRCGLLLTVDTVTVDRIVPGCKGGTYRRDNIRPACGPCNSETGGGVRRA